MSVLSLIIIATAGLVLLFSGTYWLARRMDNFGIVDIVWSYAFGAIAIFYAAASQGWNIRAAVIATLVTLWSVRLGTHLYHRVMSHHPKEDTRYAELRKTWKENFPAKMFIFFQQQAFSVLVLALPFLLAARNPAPHLHALEIAGILLWLVAITGEAVADAQLKSFRKAHPGKVCNQGLWAWSRHPNYFFEWCIWIAYFVFACASPWGWTSVICPAIMFYLLTRVTGVPMAEQQSLRSKGDAYRRYQHQVPRSFFPAPPKPSTSSLS